MGVEEEMEGYGFRLSAGCSGKAAYTKFVKHKEKRAYINVTSATGEGQPTSLEEPVRVVIYDLKSGDELDAGVEFPSLRAYLTSFKD
jgi:hypothetical protein